MILGVAQVIVNVADLDPSESALVKAGYEPWFRERGLPSHPGKRAFQLEPREALDMAYLGSQGDAPGVELTAYAGGPPGGEAAYRLAVYEPAPALAAVADETVKGDGAPGTVAAVVVDAHDPAESARFWTEGLGFREVDGTPGELEFPALIPSLRLRVSLRPGNGSRPRTTVDAEGCVLVTVLTTDVDDDARRLAASAGSLRSTEPWDEHVGGRDIRVAFAEGPSGELVELLQVRGELRR